MNLFLLFNNTSFLQLLFWPILLGPQQKLAAWKTSCPHMWDFAYTLLTLSTVQSTISRFPCKFSPERPLNFFCQHDPPSNLAGYPPRSFGRRAWTVL